MAEKKCSKDAKTFVSLLASRFNEDKQGIDSQELLSYFTDAVSNLPKSKVKSTIQKELDVHFQHLSSLLNIVPKQALPSAKSSKFNLFSKEGLENVFKAIKESKTDEEKNVIYKNLRTCYPYLNNSKHVVSSLREIFTSDDLSAVEKCTEMSIGCQSKKSIVECLSFILEEFSVECDTCINNPETNAKVERSRVLQEALHRYIVLMNHRWKANSDEIEEDSYKDLMAAMLSLYADMQLVSSSINETSSATTENLATLIFAFLGHSPEHCMDVLLQITQLDSHNGAVLVPLLRCVLERNQGAKQLTQYIKFICLAKIGLRLCSEGTKATETRVLVRKAAEKQAAPLRFVSSLSKLDQSLVERLKLSKKMTANQVTAHLLGEQREDDMETLLDLATDTCEESERQPQESHGLVDAPQGDYTEDQPLFFIDSAGGENTKAETQNVNFEEHEAEDAILHRQLTSIIGEIQQQSDSEEEEMNFDENLEDLFIIDKTPSKNDNKKPDKENTVYGTIEEESREDNSSPPNSSQRLREIEIEKDVQDEKSKEDTTSSPSFNERKQIETTEDVQDEKSKEDTTSSPSFQEKMQIEIAEVQDEESKEDTTFSSSVQEKMQIEIEENVQMEKTKEDTSSTPSPQKRRRKVEIEEDGREAEENSPDKNKPGENPCETEPTIKATKSKVQRKRKTKSKTIVTPRSMATRSSTRRLRRSSTASN